MLGRKKKARRKERKRGGKNKKIGSLNKNNEIYTNKRKKERKKDK